jgi:putative ABC transport system permease protein
MSRMTLWLRWSWRDLRRRAPLVAAIALVIALGTGTYASLMGTGAWRTQSNDASFSMLNVHDLRVALSQGTTTAEGQLAALTRSLPDAASVEAVRERLLVPTQIAGPDGLLVPGEVVGTAVGGGPGVDEVSRAAGRSLTAADDGTPTVVLERAFADSNGLPDTGELTLSGAVPVTYVGLGQSPEYFMVSGGQGTLPFLSQKSYGVLFSTLGTAQAVSGLDGRINDVVLTLRAGADRDALEGQLRSALLTADPPLSGTVSTTDDIDAYRVLYDDIAADAQLWRIIALLILGGAALAAFNLTTRVVEAQRREIGVGMALGVRSRELALRPLLFGVHVALLGVVLGVGVGLLVGAALRQVFVDLLPLPVWHTPFQVGVYAQAAALGFGLPCLAVAWPVWRAVRMEPVEAIRVGHLAARGTGLAPLLRRLRLPGRTWQQMPLRNVLRTPRRTVLTALGVAAAITTLVTTVGFLDSFGATLDRSERELLSRQPDRVTVALAGFHGDDSTAVTAVRALPQVSDADPAVLMPVVADPDGEAVDLFAATLGPADGWTPTLVEGRLDGGLVLAEKAARDLDVGVGDMLAVEHPQAQSDGSFRTVRSDLAVAGLHPNPMRPLAYLDTRTATVFGLAGVSNALTVTPADGVGTDDVRRALLAVPQVTSAEAVAASAQGMRTSLEEFMGVLRIGAAVTLVLALLIAFNTASIAGDERSREHATMLAFGLPVRSVLATNVAESALLGVLSTAMGLAGGWAVLSWMTATTVPAVMPEIGVSATLAGSTIVAALVLGVGTVALAPLLTVRRLRRLDVPATLRVVE